MSAPQDDNAQRGITLPIHGTLSAPQDDNARRGIPQDSTKARIEMLQQHMEGVKAIRYRIGTVEDNERRRKQQLDLDQQFIDYLENGGELPDSDNCVYGVMGHQGVWRGPDKEALKRARELKGVPIAMHGPAYQLTSNSGDVAPPSHAPSTVDSSPYDDSAHQMAQGATFASSSGDQRHNLIGAQIRLPLELGGLENGPVIDIDILNDTGSTLQSISMGHWASLNVNLIYVLTTAVGFANGQSETLLTPWIQLRLMNNTNTSQAARRPITPWFDEKAVVHMNPRDLLTGSNLRNQVFIASSPHNNRLFIATTKTELLRIMPAR